MFIVRKHNLVEIAVGGALAMATSQGFAQSTASQYEDKLVEVVVTSHALLSIDGLIQAEQAAKSRSSITADYLLTQQPGQSVIQSLNLLPGVNFTNSDAFGSSGGDIRMRSFDGARISLMLDGVQLNDTGNYAIYTNQQVDPEIIDHVTVNLGTTDVDSPTASATGGTINIVTRKPSKTFRVQGTFAGGSDNYKRAFGSIDTGAFGPLGTTAFLTVSYQDYDKFKGPGDLQKTQFNAKVYQDIGDDSFVAVAAHYNRNRNAFYRNLTLANIAAGGYGLDNDPSCTRVAGVNGTVQNEATSATGFTALCTNYYNVRINPSNTGNVRAESSLALTQALRLTLDASYQYVLANGGGISIVPESDLRLRGASAATGTDINGDGDTLDRVAVYSPNNTNTNRYSVSSTLLWNLTATDLIAAGYTRDYGRHRQTGQYARLDAQGNPTNIFGGLEGTPIKSADGFDLRGRDRFSIAELDQASLSYIGHWLDRQLAVNLGVRAPFFHRDLNQYCYTQLTFAPASAPGQSGPGNAYCTSEAPTATATPNVVTFAGNGATTFLRPFTGTKDYDKVLPNIGISLTPGGGPNMVYVSYAEGMSDPRTDNLYSVQILNVRPETTRSYEAGYRFQAPSLTASAAVWKTKFNNRIVTSFDPDQGISVDRNVGTVDIYGFDGELGWKTTDALSLYVSTSYNHSQVKDNLQFNSTLFLPTSGKRLVETPDWTIASRVQYRLGPVTAGLQGKYVGRRFATDVNDQQTPAYFVADLDVRYSFDLFALKDCGLQANVSNLFDRTYLGSIATSRFNAVTIGAATGQAPAYAVAAPRTFLVSLSIKF
jgi:iron complex outermembrane receptor protein